MGGGKGDGCFSVSSLAEGGEGCFRLEAGGGEVGGRKTGGSGMAEAMVEGGRR